MLNIYCDNFVFINDNNDNIIDIKDINYINYFVNKERFKLILGNNGWVDSDVYALKKFEPDDNGLFLFCLYNKPDICVILNNGADDIVMEIINYISISDSSEDVSDLDIYKLENRIFNYIYKNLDRIKFIPEGYFLHKIIDRDKINLNYL